MEDIKKLAKVRRYHNLVLAMVEVCALERNSDVDIFLLAWQIMGKMNDFAQVDTAYQTKYLGWLEQKTSTIALRELCAEVGYKYHSNLLITNAINTIDSSRLWWYGKQQELIKEKLEREEA